MSLNACLKEELATLNNVNISFVQKAEPPVQLGSGRRDISLSKPCSCPFWDRKCRRFSVWRRDLEWLPTGLPVLPGREATSLKPPGTALLPGRKDGITNVSSVCEMGAELRVDW